jgi:hypothetical protein
VPETAEEIAIRKGRATPKRTEARAARAQERKAAPKSRKEKAAVRRETMRAARDSLTSTDVSKLPKHEQRPELVYTRDLIDSRFYVAQLTVWLMVVTLVIGEVFVAATIISIATVILLIVVTALDVRLIARKVNERFPDSTTRVKLYAVRRIVAPRRMRRPVPRLARGDEIR